MMKSTKREKHRIFFCRMWLRGKIILFSITRIFPTIEMDTEKPDYEFKHSIHSVNISFCVSIYWRKKTFIHDSVKIKLILYNYWDAESVNWNNQETKRNSFESYPQYRDTSRNSGNQRAGTFICCTDLMSVLLKMNFSPGKFIADERRTKVQNSTH